MKLPERRINNLCALASNLQSGNSFTIRQLAKLIGCIVSCIPGVEYGELHYRGLEMLKSNALKASGGKFESKLYGLTAEAKSDIRWWLDNSRKCRQISHGNPDISMQTDASLQGWGTVIREKTTGGRWTVEESLEHINFLELKAVFFGLQAFVKELKGKHVHVEIDNSTAVAYIRNMGGTHSKKCNKMAQAIWHYCINNDIWLSATHIPGVLNVEADRESRLFSDSTEWSINKTVFKNIIECFGTPDVDLFASRLNNKLATYYAWKPDPFAKGIDSLVHSWNMYSLAYCFPPFSILHQVLQKIEMDQAEVLLIAPLWPTQSWFPRLLQLLIAPPALLRQNRSLLRLAHNPELEHPLWKRMHLMVCRLSGKQCKRREFLRELEKSSCLHGEKVPKNNIKHTFRNGLNLPIAGISIPCIQL